MTPLREAAEKIYRYMEPRAVLCTEVPIAYIESILKSVVEEQRNRDHMPDGPCCVALDRRAKEAHSAGKAEGLEAAAKAVDDYNSARPTNIHLTLKRVAALIRGLKA